MNAFWKDKRVLITGHTGFKGSWLTLILSQLGAKVSGFALEPDTDPALFTQLGLATDIDHFIGDIRSKDVLASRVKMIQPDVIFHLAAQPLVLASYQNPVETWDTNIMGSVHLLDALKHIDHPCSVVMVTTDKVYKNNELGKPYREEDTLGGHDPYSASKAAMEFVVQSYRDSFYRSDGHIRIASARAGNVIGGGDWAENRIVPDIARALQHQKPVEVRNPNSLRPWQHVLEPLAGYMRLAELLTSNAHQKYQTAFNFGPEPSDFRQVSDLVETALNFWTGSWVNTADPNAPHEAGLLSLNIEKTRAELNFTPRWNFGTAVKQTIDWYRKVSEGALAKDISQRQIAAYFGN